MKGHIRLIDRKSQQHGKVLDLDWLLRDLGLEEIVFPPPPLREWARIAVDEDEGKEGKEKLESLFDEEEWNYNPMRGEAPAPGLILGDKDIEKRLRRFTTSTNEHEKTKFLWGTLGPWQGVGEVCAQVADALTEEEWSLLVSQVFQVAWLLHPDPPPNARLYPGRLLHYFSDELDAMLASAPRQSRAFDPKVLTGGTPQPVVVEWGLASMLNMRQEISCSAGRTEEDEARAGLIMICMLKAAVREFCHWPVK